MGEVVRQANGEDANEQGADEWKPAWPALDAKARAVSEETHRLLHGASLRDINISTINIGMPPLYESAAESGDDGDLEYQGLHFSPMVTRSGSR
jgi:hypothetical protein